MQNRKEIFINGKINREATLYWDEKYDIEEDLYMGGEEKEIGNRLRKTNRLNKTDLETIIKWKFQGRLIGRQKRILKLSNNCSDDFIKHISELAFLTNDEIKKIKYLRMIDGVGNALCSVILFFYAPKNYGILDIHSWRELFGKKEPDDVFVNYKRLIIFLNRLREFSSEINLPCRIIEKARLYMEEAR